jgi:hypothetical protein
MGIEMLKEEDRSKLDGIVSQMESNGENTEDIQFVVNDFKSKYDVPRETQKEPGALERISQNFQNIGKPAESNIKTPTILEKGLSVAGRTLGSVGSIPVELGKNVYNAIPNWSPSSNKSPAPIVQKLKTKIPEAISSFTEAHPRAATLAETALNLSSVIPGERIIGGIAPKLGLGTSKALEKGAARIQGTKVKINSPEFKKGAQNEMYTKYEVFGNANKVREQWQNKIDDTYNQVKEKIQNLPDVPENYASIDDIFNSAEKSVDTYGKSPTARAAIKNSLEKLKEEFQSAYPDGKINILDAQSEKQVIGKKGDWLARAGEISGNPEASINSQAHNALYDALKTNVENKGAPGIKELNKQLSEMIPMERAASKSMLVANRKNLISLDDFIGGVHAASSAAVGNFAPAAIVGANILSKSPSIAKGMHVLGKGIKWASQ